MHWSYVFLALTHGLGTLTIIQVYCFYVGQGTHLVLVEKSQIVKTFWSILLKHHFDLKVLDWVLLSWMLSWWCCNNMEKSYWPFVRGIHQWLVDSLHKGPVMWTFDISIVVSLNNLLNKQLSGWWFETPRCSCDVTVVIMLVLKDCCLW